MLVESDLFHRIPTPPHGLPINGPHYTADDIPEIPQKWFSSDCSQYFCRQTASYIMHTYGCTICFTGMQAVWLMANSHHWNSRLQMFGKND